ncbi:MAG: sensor histidine kinase [Galactobacter sp.]|uniref:sensor histidine kinase n=1 Tax=Galactobacter sp. TaxID=2676125 RepID=UPI0025C40C16|nr:histidine kinase [Galactobacter sp.]
MDEPRSAWHDLVKKPWVEALCYLLLSLFFTWLGWSGLWDVFSVLNERPSAWFTLITALPASAVLLVKRPAPLAGLLLALALFVADLLTMGGLIPLLVLLEMMHAYLLTLGAAARRKALGVVMGGSAVLTLLTLLLSRDPQLTVLFGLQFGALFGFSYWYANSTTQSRELVQLYRQRSENAKRLAALDRETAVQVERDRMAWELHDVVVGHVSAVAIRSEAALGLPPGTDSGVAGREALKAVRDSSLEAHSALRSMIQVLRSGDNDFTVSPGRAQLPDLVNNAQASGVRAELHDNVESELPAALDQTIGTVVQEALSNSVKHASGAAVDVRVDEDEYTVTTTVRSTGGVALQQPALQGSGIGLTLLSERVKTLGGTWSAGQDGAGWLVRAQLPKEMKA